MLAWKPPRARPVLSIGNERSSSTAWSATFRRVSCSHRFTAMSASPSHNGPLTMTTPTREAMSHHPLPGFAAERGDRLVPQVGEGDAGCGHGHVRGSDGPGVPGGFLEDLVDRLGDVQVTDQLRRPVPCHRLTGGVSGRGGAEL